VLARERDKEENGRVAESPPMTEWLGRIGVSPAERPAVLAFAAVLMLLLVLRLIVLWSTPLELGPDEAQYWFWSQTPAWGYFSKPPMIAWVIGATSGLCGTEEPCVRLAAPLFHAATAIVLFFLGRALYGSAAGILAGLAYATLPGVWLSSTLITTDVPLLFFWSLTLLATVHLLERRSVLWGVVWGLSMGLGLLSKYAMGYALIGVVLAFYLTREPFRRLRESDWILGFLLALALIAPNLQWNLENGFATVRHTASNANWGAQNLFNFGKLGEFLGGQILLLGPVLAGLSVWGLARGWRRLGPASQTRATAILLAFALPVLVVVTAQAFISRANANWAAVALAPLCVLGAGWVQAHGLRRLFWTGFGINSALGLFLAAMAVSPALVEALNRHNDVKRLRGWNELAQIVVRRAHDGEFDAILSDDREDLASFLYYARDATIPIHSFVPATGPNYEFHLSIPLTKMKTGKVLFISRQADVSAVTARFASAQKLETVTMPLGGTKTRVLNLYELYAPFDPAWSGLVR
jgi:4-amino-4-deoxy-L-arabinose transferase-like glycosyltransferase